MVPTSPQALHYVSLGFPFVFLRVPVEGLHAAHMVGVPKNQRLLEQNFPNSIQSPRSPSTALLNQLISKASKPSRKLIFFIFLGAKITLARAWKRPKVSIIAAKQKILWIMSQEKMVSSILDNFARFREIKDPWAKYMGIGDSIFVS